MKNLENKKYWIWFSLIKGLGSKRKQKLLESYKTPEKIYKLTKKELIETNGIGEKMVENILKSKDEDYLKKYILYMQKHNIDIININDENYPKILKEIYDPPISLYIKGNKNILNNTSVAIIGCRQASQYGIKVAKYFGYNLAKNEVNVVSGLAKGIDSYAHIGSICANGKTIAVIGNGIDTIYPKENINIANKILEK